MPSFLQPAKSWKWGLPLVLLGALAIFAKVMNTNPPTNSAHTSLQNDELQTRVYETQPELAVKTIAALRLSTYGRNWKLVAQNNVSKGEVQLVFHVPVFLFTDILTVHLKRKDAETTQVDVESHAQIGKGDFGENRRHILQILAAIDEDYSPFPI